MAKLIVIVAGMLAVAEGIQSMSCAAQGIGRLAMSVAGRRNRRGRPRAW